MPTHPSGLGPIGVAIAAPIGPSSSRLAEFQAGAVSLEQLLSNGMTKAEVRWRLTSGRWQVVHPGVYYVYTGPLARESSLWAALLHGGQGAVLDGPTAAVLHGLFGFDDPVIHIRVPHERHPEPRPGLVIRRTRHLEGIAVRGGFPVMRIERAVVTIAGAGRTGALAASVQQGLTTAERVRGVLLSLGPIKRRALMLRALADIEGGSRSELERIFLRALRRARLPIPVRNHPATIEGRRLWIDACYPEFRIAIEIDGRLYHLMTEDWEDDLVRQNEVVLSGWNLLRFSARAIRRGEAAPTVERALIRSGWDRSVSP